MTRHFLIEDPDGRNPRHITLAEYVEALEQAQQHGTPVPQLAFIESDMRLRRAPATLAEAAQPLADC